MSDIGSDFVSVEPLHADPRRQATNAIRGYVYQVAQTVLEWLELGDDEALFVEGAEDFDRLGQVNESTQVKDVAANLTLRSADVIESIQNCWNARVANPGRDVRFRLLTTAHAGTERDAPFGIPGLAFWNAVRIAPPSQQRTEDIERIASFVSNADSLSDDLRDFLRGSGAQAIYENLIEPLRYDYAQDAIPDLEDRIRDRLVLLGAYYHVPPEDAEKALDTLFVAVWRAASRQTSERLDRALLLRTFTTFSHRSVSLKELEGVREMTRLAELLRVREFGASEIIAFRPAPATSPLPPLPVQYFVRHALVEAVKTSLREDGTAILVGSRYSGKTTAAVASAEAFGGRWLWVDVGRSPNAGEKLRQALFDISLIDKFDGVFIDDVPATNTPANLSAALLSVLSVLRQRGAAAIITTDREFAESIVQSTGLAQRLTTSIEPFSKEEIVQMLQSRGCPENAVDSWALLLEITTGGEPLLVAARLQSIEEHGFASPTETDFVEQSPAIVGTRRDVAATAADSLDGDAFELLMRLSLGLHRYTEEVITAVSDASPALSSPGIAINRLNGPWLQRLGEASYRVTPLAFNLASSVKSPHWTTRFHGVIARSLLVPKTVTPSDCAAALLHAVLGDENAVANSMLNAVLSLKHELWESFAQSAFWLAGLWLDEAIPDKFSTPTRALFRLVQLRLSATPEKAIDAALIENFDHEYSYDSDDEFTLVTRFLGLNIIFGFGRANLSVRDAVRFSEEWAMLLERLPPKELLESIAVEGVAHGFTDGLAAMGFLSLTSVTELASLDELLNILTVKGPAFSKRYLSMLEGDAGLAHGFITNIWAPLLRTGEAGWLEAVGASFHKAFDTLLTFECDNLAGGFANALLSLTADCAPSAEAALPLYVEMRESAEQRNIPELELGRAHISVVLEDFDSALAIYGSLLPGLTWDGIDLEAYIDYREAARCEAARSNWSGAASWLGRAAGQIDIEQHALWAAALNVDEAFALWKAFRYSDAAEPLWNASQRLAQLPEAPGDQRQHMVRKRIGHELMWMLAPVSSTRSGFSEPFVAMASNLDTALPEGEALPRATPVDLILAQILKYAFVVGNHDRIGDELETRLSQSPVAIARSLASWTRVYRAAAAGATVGFINLLAAFHEALRDAGRQELPGDQPFPALELNPVEVPLGVFVPVMRGVFTADVIVQWREEAKNIGVGASLEPILASIERSLVTVVIPARAALERATEFYDQLFSSVRYAAIGAPSEQTWLNIHGVWILYFATLRNRECAGAMLLELIKPTWERIAARHAIGPLAETLRIALETPRRPWETIEAIVGGAEQLVNVKLPPEIHTELSSAIS